MKVSKRLQVVYFCAMVLPGIVVGGIVGWSLGYPSTSPPPARISIPAVDFLTSQHGPPAAVEVLGSEMIWSFGDGTAHRFRWHADSVRWGWAGEVE